MPTKIVTTTTIWSSFQSEIKLMKCNGNSFISIFSGFLIEFLLMEKYAFKALFSVGIVAVELF